MTNADEAGHSFDVVPMRRALVVEDEILIRMDIAEALRDIGWEVVEVSTADDAIDVLTRYSSFQLLLTDVQQFLF